jgi:hypothetical protein
MRRVDGQRALWGGISLGVRCPEPTIWCASTATIVVTELRATLSEIRLDWFRSP